MPNLSRFRALKKRERAVVAIAVLLDGHDAQTFLASDLERGLALTKAAADLAELAPELRLPLVGSLLRAAIADLSEDDES